MTEKRLAYVREWIAITVLSASTDTESLYSLNTGYHLEQRALALARCPSFGRRL